MRLPDVNVLLNAVVEESPHHVPARSWLEDSFRDHRDSAWRGWR